MNLGGVLVLIVVVVVVVLTTGKQSQFPGLPWAWSLTKRPKTSGDEYFFPFKKNGLGEVI